MLVVPMPPQASHLHPPSSSPSSYPPPSSSAPTTSTPSETRPKLATKPKLTLQTSSLPRTFGRSTTGLSLSVATASPTVNNTFKNAYEPCPPSAIPATSSSTPSPIKISTPLKHSRQPSSNNPYQLPLGVKSILRNSPLDSTSHRRSVSIAGGNGASGSRRVFFPIKKQVAFRQSLEEEIRTVHYVARHSDLLAEESGPDNQKKEQPELKLKQEQPVQEGSDSDSDSNSSLAPSDSGSDDDQTKLISKSERRKRKNLSAERQVRAAALLDGLEGDAYGISTPQTPRQGRVKRRREWTWTLGSVEARNEIYGLPQTPDEAKSFESEEKKHEHEHENENENETESQGSCESDWTSASWSGSSVASFTNKPDEFQDCMTHDIQ